MATLTPTSQRQPGWAKLEGFQTWKADQRISPTEATHAVGLDTPVTTHPIYSHDGTPVPRKVETWRDGHHVGIVGKDSYHVVPFVEGVLPYIDAIMLETPYYVTAAGKTHNGARELMVLQWPETLHIDGEQFNGYAYVINSHDGSTSLALGLRKERVFCTNQIPALAKASTLKLRHTVSWQSTIEQARQLFKITLQHDELFEQQVRAAMATTFTEVQFGKAVDALAPVKEKDGTLKTGRGMTMAENARDAMWTSWSADDLGNIRGTLFGAQQAMVAYYDWAYSSDKGRALRAVTATTDQPKVKAFKTLAALV